MMSEWCMWTSSAGPVSIGAGWCCEWSICSWSAGGAASGCGCAFCSGEGISIPGICWCWGKAALGNAASARALAAAKNLVFTQCLRNRETARLGAASLFHMLNGLSAAVLLMVLHPIHVVTGMVFLHVLAAVLAAVLLFGRRSLLMLGMIGHWGGGGRSGRLCRQGRSSDQSHHRNSPEF
jgi:hypothetical protein